MIVKDEWCILGYPIIGGWLPFIGWRTFEASEEQLEEFRQVMPDTVAIEINAFVAEWFLHGWMSTPKYRIIVEET